MSFGEGEYSAPAHLNNFLKFHTDNPHVLPMLVNVVDELWERGCRRYSISGVFEVVRFKIIFTTQDPLSSFKLSNSHKPFYARLILEMYPKYKGIFKIKQQSCRDEDRPILEHLEEYRKLQEEKQS